MKKLFIITLIVCSLFIQQKTFADTTMPISSIVKSIPSSIDFSKTYKTTSENLLYLLLSAINAQNYSIEEIQFKTGNRAFQTETKGIRKPVSK